MSNIFEEIFDFIQHKDPKPVITKPLCTPDPAVLLACKIAQHYEGLFLKPYLDPAGVPTIGWGSTYYEDGAKVTLEDQYVDIPLNTNTTAALADWVYNLGPVAFERSTMLKYVNSSNSAEAGRQMILWDHANGEVLPGLEARRKTEQTLYLTGNLVFYDAELNPMNA